MKDVLSYKGITGSVHFNAEDSVFHGKIEGVDDLVTFEGKSVDEIIKAFHGEVDDYIELCNEQGKEPLRSYKGSFNVRVSPRAVETAIKKGLSLNQLVQKAIEKELIHKE